MRAGYDAALDEARALRDESRRVIAALQARYADETGVACAEDQAQQRARLFRRGHRAARRASCSRRRSTRPSSTARPWPARCASPPPSSPSSRPRSPTPPTARSASSSRSSSGWRARDRRQRRAIKAAAEALAALDVAAALAHARGRARLRAARGRPLARLRDRGRPPSGGRAGARTASRSSPTTAICRRPSERAPAASGCSPGRTWPASRPSCARTR